MLDVFIEVKVFSDTGQSLEIVFWTTTRIFSQGGLGNVDQQSNSSKF